MGSIFRHTGRDGKGGSLFMMMYVVVVFTNRGERPEIRNTTTSYFVWRIKEPQVLNSPFAQHG